MDIKDFLYRWCSKMKFRSPTYTMSESEDCKNGNRFKAEIKIFAFVDRHDDVESSGDSFPVEFGFGSNQKTAKTDAATNMCKRLVEIGLLSDEAVANRALKVEEIVFPDTYVTLKRKNVEKDPPDVLLLKTERPIAPIPNGETKQSWTKYLKFLEQVPKFEETSSSPLRKRFRNDDAQQPTTSRDRAWSENQSASADAITSRDSSVTDLVCIPEETSPGGKKSFFEHSVFQQSSSRDLFLSENQCNADCGSIDTAVTSSSSSSRDQFLNEFKADDEVVVIDVLKKSNVKRQLDGFSQPSGTFDSLSRELWSHYRSNKQPDWLFAKKFQLTEMMTAFIRDRLRRSDAKLIMVGSTVTGLGSYNADLDLCFVCLPDHRFNYCANDDREYALATLKRLRTLMYEFCSNNCQAIQFIPAKVPILRIVEFAIDRDVRIDIDINVNNITGIRNSHLLYYYSIADERFPALALVIKHWAIKADICDAKSGTFSSYSLMLLLLHFLLAGTDPPVLPNLQQQMPAFFQCFEPLSPWQRLPHGLPRYPLGRNGESVGVLLLKFFDYYVNKVDFAKDGFSVYNSSKFPRSRLPSSTEHFFIYVEEPFEGQNVARCVLETECYERIVESFQSAFYNLQSMLQLSSIDVDV